MGRYKARKSMISKSTSYYKPMNRLAPLIGRQEKILLEDFHDLKLFYNQVLQILIFNFKKFQDGKITSLNDNFTFKIYEDLLCLIQEWSDKDNILATALTFRQIYDPNLFYKYRNLGFLILDTLNQAIHFNQLNDSLLRQNNNLNSRLDELNNIDKVKEHIKYLVKLQYALNSSLKCETSVNSKIKLKPQYKIYIDRFGFPKDGLFDSQKLLVILNELSIC